MIHGSCLCGDIAWEIDGPVDMMSNCHCSMCRKVHGTAFGTYVAVPADRFRWTSSPDTIRTYESSPGAARPFCPRCGSVVAFLSFDGNIAFMPAGNMDGELGRQIESHIFVDSKAPWFEITDAVEQHPAYPPGYGESVETAPRPPETPDATGGSCLCNAVAFEFDGTPQRMGCCHCSRCRKSRSAAHSTQLFVPEADFRWLRGREHISEFKLPEAAWFRTAFCNLCGSPMPSALPDRVIMIPAGALDQDPGARIQAHIYVGSRASWFEITDGKPQFDEMPEMA